MTNAVNLKATYRGRPVFVLATTHLDYYPRGCGLKTKRRDGVTQYCEGCDPNTPSVRALNG